jgi:predicted DNA-binding transcriptional regulator YafY
MYSPTTRLLTMLELLQSYKQMSGSEIARRLEVDPRTVRRYIVMLQDMGIPVEAERGPYGAYQLRRGYKLPPLMFTDSEAIALTLGLMAIRELRFPVAVAAVEGALAKTERVMPEKLLQQARALQEAISFNVNAPVPFESAYVTLLSTAVQQRQPVHVRYAAFSGEMTERGFDPYGIVYHEGYWYTSGYCHLRRDLRTFRLDRVAALEPLDGSFERPADFDALDHVLRSISPDSGTEQIEVLLKTTLEEAQRVVPEWLGTLEATDDGVMLRRGSYRIDWLPYFLLNLDFPIVVRQPASLRDEFERIAARAMQIVADS